MLRCLYCYSKLYEGRYHIHLDFIELGNGRKHRDSRIFGIATTLLPQLAVEHPMNLISKNSSKQPHFLFALSDLAKQ